MQGELKESIKRFFLISVSGFIINSFVLAGLLQSGFISPFLSSIVAITVIPIFSFIASRFWGFKNHNKKTK